MALQPWNGFFPDITLHLPLCPEPLMEHELRRAAQTLFAQTRAWQIDHLIHPVIANTSLVNIVLNDPNLIFIRVEAAWWDNRALNPVTQESLDSHTASSWQTNTGFPNSFFVNAAGQLRLHPIPISGSATGLRLRISVTPSNTAIGISSDMAFRFRDAICTGAKANLLLIPGQTWTDNKLAMFYRERFSEMSATINIAAARGNVGASIPAKIHWF